MVTTWLPNQDLLYKPVPADEELSLETVRARSPAGTPSREPTIL